MKRILTVIGARPQFIKASVVSKALQESQGIEEILLHTGQHFDSNMSDIFFNQLNIPRPSIQLNINGGTHGEMTASMLVEIEQAILAHKPDRVLVYGDTNSTLAGALAAAKLHVPVAHVEAGLRSFNMRMPEEINRILTDQLSDILFCPTDTAMRNLTQEGFDEKRAKAMNVGDVMQDSSLFFGQKAVAPKEPLPQKYVLSTLHRAENTDSPERLKEIVIALNRLHRDVAPVVLPLHPRTRKLIQQNRLNLDVQVINPVGYLEMLHLLKNADLVLTDSGGVQKEAFFFGKPCVTMRDQTEWTELVDCGANVLVGANESRIVDTTSSWIGKKISVQSDLFGGGQAAKRIAKVLEEGDFEA